MGSILYAMGLQIQSQHYLIMARLIMGMGYHSLMSFQSRILARWFVGRDLTLIIILNITMSRLGSISSSILSPLLVSSPDFYFDFDSVQDTEKKGLIVATWFGILLSVTCLGISCICWVLDTLLMSAHYTPIQLEKWKQIPFSRLCIGHVTCTHFYQEDLCIEQDSASHLSHSVIKRIQRPTTFSTNGFHSSLSSPEYPSSTDRTLSNEYNPNDFSPHFKKQFWLILGILLLYYSATAPYTFYLSDQIQRINGFSSIIAGRYMSIPDFISCVLTPILSCKILRLSHSEKHFMLILNGLLLTLLYTWLSFKRISVIALIVHGILYSIFTSVIFKHFYF